MYVSKIFNVKVQQTVASHPALPSVGGSDGPAAPAMAGPLFLAQRGGCGHAYTFARAITDDCAIEISRSLALPL